jgi:hypothetical protein
VRVTTPLFVLGGHRGGTTLLQRLLNSYDDVAVWGEHEGVLSPIADAYFRGAESTRLFANVRTAGTSDPRRDWQAWMTAVGRDEWDASFRGLVQSLFLPAAAPAVRHWGFKEIRYGAAAGDRAIDLLVRLFPDARLAFIVRNPFNMLASARSRPEGPRDLAAVAQTCRRIARRFESFLAWRGREGVRTYWIVYEELVQAAGDIQRLVEDLGHAIGPAQREVLAAEGGGRGSSFHDAAVNDRWRRLPPSWLALAREVLGPVAVALGYSVPPLGAGWRLAGPLLRWRVTGSLRATD